MGPATRLAVLQNGVEHVERFASLVPPARIVPAVVDIPASRTAPGRMVQHAYGTIVVPEGDDGMSFVALFEGTPIAVSTTADFRSRAWRKLCLNAAGAVPALTLAPTGPAWTADLEAIVRAIVGECAAVGRAEGAVIGPEVIEAVVDGARNSGPGAVNSLQADRMAGRPMEIDARNGVIVRLGRKHGIATPVNAMIVALLEASRRRD
jgi:2-dehydropantoate 2-reductase